MNSTLLRDPRQWERTFALANQVKPKILRRLKTYCRGNPASQAKNGVWEGDNLSAMVSLKHRFGGKIDLILTDPPYNTGKEFRYNDRWDEMPDDPGVGRVVSLIDPDRHSKWEKFMLPRLLLMRDLLAPHGIVAVCIDHRELFRLGILMNEVFGEENQLGIINWQKSYAPRGDNSHISTATEYVLIYAQDLAQAKTGLEPRTEKMDSKYKNPDSDPNGVWRSDNPTAGSGDRRAQYGIQSPFTGEIHYPGNNYWRYPKKKMLAWLNAWGTEYKERYIFDSSKVPTPVPPPPPPPYI